MCGNWGVLVLREFLQHHKDRTSPGGLPTIIETLIREIINIVELRGAQAGGLNLLQSIADQRPQQCKVRVLKPKRGNLGKTLFDKVHRKLFLARLKGSLLRNAFSRCSDPSWPDVLVQGHSRFGTSSNPAVLETHPHQWSPPTQCAVWSWSKEVGWYRRMCSYSLNITHNGDFDAWAPYRRTTLGVSDLGLWLERVLAVPNHTSGDSPKIAGVIELLACQGMWYHSVRQAYHLHVATHVQQACGWMNLSRDSPGTVPNRHTLQIWADVIEKEFVKFANMDTQGRLLAEDNTDLFHDFLTCCVNMLYEGKSGDLLKQWVSPNKVHDFVVSAVEGFRDNDLMSVTTAFLRRAEGTFGISVTSSVDPHRIVLAARGQPISIGFGGCFHGGCPTIAYWSSEPAALQVLNKKDIMINKRYDLNDEIGEVIELRAMNFSGNVMQADQKTLSRQISGGSNNSGKSSTHSHSPSLVETLGGDVPNLFPVSMNKSETAAEKLPNLLMIRGLDFTCPAQTIEDWYPKLMTFESFQSRLIPMHEKMQTQGPSMLDANAGKSKDCVAKDIAHVPWMVREIDVMWSDQESLNRISSQNFSEKLLMALASKAETSCFASKVEKKYMHLVVFGIETSLWLGQQFIADLQRLFPSLNMIAMSSNVLLGLLQQGAGHVNQSNWIYTENSLGIDKDTIGLALSHSGTTYPTVWAARLFRQRTKKLFAMSCAFDSLLACSIGQTPHQKFEGLLFSTLAGTRPAEAATVATVAMHHTLSHLLLACAAVATDTKLPSLQYHTRSDIVEGVADDQLEEMVVETSRSCTTMEMDVKESSAKLCTASRSSVKDMHKLLLSMYWGVVSSCGIDADGNKSSGCHTELIQAGHRWSHHITEGYWATFIPAAYVAVTVIPGFLPVTEFGTWCHNLIEDQELPEYGLWLLRVLDFALYVFMGIIVAMIHRKLTGRRLWARFTTRTLLLVESTANYKVLRAYTSKLVALSYRFATISVVGQNGADHMVHEYTHKAQSDVLLAVGLPDGRLPSAAPVEGCVLMACSQAQFIKKGGHGVECYCMGHNTWTRPKLFVRALKLPTFRPLFATEKLLFPDQLHSAASVVPGHHGTNPGSIVQRHKDMLKQHLDPYGMPQLNLTPNDLKSYMHLGELLSFQRASQILEEIIEKHCLDANLEMVPCGLPQFLSKFMSEGPSSSRVFVVSPGKSYASPRKFYDSPSKFSDDSLSPDFLEEILSPNNDKQAVNTTQSRIYQYLGKLDGENQEQMKEVKQASQVTNQLAHLDVNEFLALLHGDELQRWVRSARYRWKKLCKMRGIFSLLSTENGLKRRRADSAVLASGLTLKCIVLSWRKLASINRDPQSPKKNVASSRSVLNVQDASIKDAMRSRSSRRSSLQLKQDEKSVSPADRSQPTACGYAEVRRNAAIGRPITQGLVDSGAQESQILRESRPVELFYEARVASAERLVSWFVLLHAMAKPSSQLPFLSYELGKSESRLRVASTPAPIPLHDVEAAAEYMAEDGDKESLLRSTEESI